MLRCGPDAAAGAARRSGVDRRREMPARRLGVEDAPAGERRTGRGSSDDQGVAGGGGDRLGQAQDRGHLATRQRGGVAPAAPDRRLHACSADMHEDARAIGRQGSGVDPAQRHRRTERNEDAVRRDDRRVGREDRAALDSRRVHAREVDGRPAADRTARDVPTVDLQAADADRRPARDQPKPACGGDRAAAEAAGHDGPAATDGKHPVDREPRPGGRRVRPVPDHAVAKLVERRPDLVDPLPGRPGRRRRPARREASSRPAAPGPRRPPRPTRPRRPHRPSSRPRAPRRSRAHRAAPRCSSVCARGPSSAATTSIAASISPAPTSMLPISRSCPGTSTKSSSVPSSSVRWAYPTSIVMPAPLLLGQAVGVDAGQGPEQRRLAVVDVARGPDDDGHAVSRSLRADGRRERRRRAPARPFAGPAPRAGLDPADDRRAAAPQRARPARSRPAPAIATPDDGSVSPGQRAAADRRPRSRRRRPVADGRRDGFGPARSPSTGAAIIRQTGTSASARPARYSPSVAATAASVTLSGRIARASGSRRSRAIRSARPTTSPACGPPTSLSPLNVTMSAPAASRSDGIGSWASPYARVSGAARRSRGRRRRSRRGGGRARRAPRRPAPPMKPSWRKFDGWTRRTRLARPSSSGAAKSATRVRFVVPTSISRAPARRTISGIRTPPPISTSSPRETATPPRARRARRRGRAPPRCCS